MIIGHVAPDLALYRSELFLEVEVGSLGDHIDLEQRFEALFVNSELENLRKLNTEAKSQDELSVEGSSVRLRLFYLSSPILENESVCSLSDLLRAVPESLQSPQTLIVGD